MDDLISRQAAIDVTWFNPSYTDPLNVLTEVRDKIKVLPSTQPEPLEPEELDFVQPHKKVGVRLEIGQPEIIRCKDCEHWSRESICDGFCSEDCMRHDEDFYCGYANRRTDE